jgi:hypothetical protein
MSSKPTTTPALTQTDILNDLSTLLSLPPTTIQTLLAQKQPPHPSNQAESASLLLSTFSPSAGQTDPKGVDAGVNLSVAYTRDMRSLQVQGLEAQLEKAGEGIEGVRDRAEGVQTALAEVKM